MQHGPAASSGSHPKAPGFAGGYLLLNINFYMEDAESGKMKFARSVDIRGNTDESWRRGLDYLLRNHLLREP